MMHLFYLNLVVSLSLAIFTAISIFQAHSTRSTRQRLQGLMQAVPKATRRERGEARFGRAISKIALWIRSHLGLAEAGGLGQRIRRTGSTGPVALDLYTAARIIGPLVALVAGALIPVDRIFWMLSLPAVAYLAPDLVLERCIHRRRRAVRCGIPDAVDLLVICVDAGLGLDQALLRVAEELVLSHPAIHQEFLQINREQRAGKPRLDAWLAMAERVALPEIDAFVNMLMQTERFGTPAARALSTFAAQTRLKRIQKAEEQAAKTTIKIIFPLVIFIFPSIFIVLIGPAVIVMMRGLASGF